MLERKSANVSGYIGVDLFMSLDFLPPLHRGLQAMRKRLEVNVKKKKGIFFLSLSVSSPPISGGEPGRAGSGHKSNGG